MHKTRNVNTNTRCHYLKLVSSNSTPPGIDQPEKLSAKSVDSREIRHLTTAMMNRLWIPQTSTIVGLLGVRKSQDNFEELTKWIEVQLSADYQGSSSPDLNHLERIFKRTVDSYPEL